MNFYAHQQKIIDEDPKYAGLWLGTGSGKTRIALALSRGTVLVIAPKTQVEDGNWQREWKNLGLKNFDTHLRLITFDIFKRDAEILPRHDTVIVDEAHGMLGMKPNTRRRKGVEYPDSSQRYEALEKYLERTKPDRFYPCTATIIKSPMTVFAALKLLGHEREFYAWRNTYYTKLPMPGREVWSPKKTDQVKDMLAQEVRDCGYTGRLDTFFDVPEQTFRTIHVDLTEPQRARMKGLRIEYPEPIVRIGKRHQIENGVLTGDEFNGPETFPSTKIDRILEYAEEFPRMVIFVKYSMQIDAIWGALKEEGYTAWVMDGRTPDRAQVLREAQSNDGVLIVQAQMSAGWQLPETPVMIFASRNYSFVDYDQALGRIQRADNIKKNLYISLVVKGGVDEAVDEALAHKSDFNERIYEETRG